MPQQQCVKCKKFLKNGTKKCPHCGTVQPEESIITPSPKPAKKANNSQEDSNKEPLGETIMLWCFAILIAFAFTSCTNSCSCSGGGSSGANYSKRAQELGVTTREYRDTYNHYRYGNP